MNTENTDSAAAKPVSYYFTATNVISLVLALVIVSGLFPVIRPMAVSSQPWRVELLISLFVLAPFVWARKTIGRGFAGTTIFVENSVKVPIASMVAFIVWSGISVFWSISSYSVAHHTLVWTMYLSVLVLSLGYFQVKSSYVLVYRTFAFTVFFLSISCVVDYLAITDFYNQEGPFRIRYGKFAEMLITFTPFLCVWSLYQRSQKVLFASIAVWLLGWLTVMLSLSKGAFIAGVIGQIIVLAGCIFFSQKRVRQRSIVLAGVWLATTILFQVGASMLSDIPSTANYIGGSADHERSSTSMRRVTWGIGQQMASDHWFRGVGADNFGIVFNKTRIGYAAAHPTTGTIEVAEDYTVERAHNELLQIFAELGVVGIVLFAAPFIAFTITVLIIFWRKKLRLSPLLWASIGGMIAFAASSFVSSFSFRAAQNGIVFFIVFGIAVNETVKMRTTGVAKTHKPVGWFIPLVACCSLGAVLSLAYSGSKAIAEYYVCNAERTEQINAAERYYRSAVKLDPDYASAHYYLSSRYAGDKDFSAAAAELRQAIDRGLGVSLTYSLLTKYQVLTGDLTGAENTLKEGLAIYPNSVFLRVRYTLFLEERGRADDALKQFNLAVETDAKQAKGWYSMIKDGSVAAFYKARTDATMVTPSELIPENGKYDYVDPNGGRQSGATTNSGEK